MKTLGKFTYFLACFLLRGWATVIMWGWFIVPLGMRQIGFAHALGISMTVAIFRGVSNRKKDKEEEQADLVSYAVGPVIVLAFGWIYHSFM